MFSHEDHANAVERLEYSERQVDLLTRIRELGDRRIGPAAKQTDRDGAYPQAGIDALREADLIGLAVPEPYGGRGAGFQGDVVLLVLALMELASYCSSTSQVFALHNTGVQLIHAMGDEKQKRHFFDDVLRGNLFASFGSEANASRFALASTLRKTDGGFILNGKKIFATGSPGAKWAFWRSVSDDAHGNQEERYMMPVVLLSAPGVAVADDWDGMGQRGTGSGTVTADNVFVPELHIMGGPGDYSRHAPFFASQFHIHFAAQFVGIATGAYREALRYVKEKARSWSDAKSAAEDPVTQLRVGDMAAKLAAARQLVLRAARLLQAYNDRPELQAAVHVAASHAKIVATETSLDITNSVFQVMGARAATRAYGFDMYYRNARTLTLHDSVDKQRETVGKYELGLV
ncbi:acyl-CoA dehydrogenase family protein [Paenibacillus hemerocallicola]|nr:acyl-CoA dehydrogenase family protein [Paenibacillus hemerocallicola]